MQPIQHNGMIWNRCGSLLCMSLVLSIVTVGYAVAGDDPISPEPTAKTVPWLSDLATSYRDALANQRPILVRVGGEGCPWCKKLESEIVTQEIQAELRNWTLVYLDVERDAAELGHLAIGPIPAFRSLSTQGRLVDSLDGFVEADRLVEWLRDTRATATQPPDGLLLGQGQPTLLEVMRLIRQFESRDAAVREAAIHRIIPFPNVAGRAVLKALREGGLATKLAVYEILQQWKAPVDEIDPWRPDTLSPEALDTLDQWLTDLDPAATAKTAPAVLTQEDLASVRREIQKMLEADGPEVVALRERIARFGSEILPDVLQLLKDASTDRDRERLLALRYRLASSSSLVLTWPGGLRRLADRDPKQRHKAAEELAAIATQDLQPLLLELFSDPDPLVRELSLQGLRHVGGKSATAALVKLLADPEPNVRAAVLKQLSEDAPKEMVDEISEYVKQETDADLVVHAVRYFRAVKNAKAVNSLLPLFEHSSWQVRAEAAEAVSEAFDEMRYDIPADTDDAPDITAALLNLLDDSDSFVVSRALEGLQYVDADRAVEPLVQAAKNHPSLAEKIVAILANASHMREKAIPHLREFFTSPDPELRAGAITGLCRTNSEQLQQEIPVALEDPDTRVREAAALGLVSILANQHPLRSHADLYDASPTFPGAIYSTSALDSALERVMEVEIESGGPGGGLLQGVFDTIVKGVNQVASEGDSATPEDNRDPFDDTAGPPTAPPIPLGKPPKTTGIQKPSADNEVPPSKPAIEIKVEPAAKDEPSVDNEMLKSEPAVEIKSEPAIKDEPTEEEDGPRLDAWLAECYAGEKRAPWMNDLVEPLETMLTAETAAERNAAGLALLPFGKNPEALLTIVAAAKEDADVLETSARALIWVMREERTELFWNLVDAARNDNDISLLTQTISEIDDPTSIEMLWQLLKRETVSNELLYSVNYALREAYFDDDWYDPSEITPLRRARIANEIEPHCAEGSDTERLLATVFVSKLAADKAIPLAQQLMDDETISEPIRRDAFQLYLACHDSKKQQEVAIATLSDSQVERRKVAIKYLAHGESMLEFLDNTRLDLDMGFSSVVYGMSRGPKYIIPEPPSELKAEHVRPFLQDGDPEIAACAGYLLALFGDEEGLAPLLHHWRSKEGGSSLDRMVYRAIASLDDPDHIIVLREIYATYDEPYEARDFYWTIRIMSGPEILQFRKRIRDEMGTTILER